MKTESINEMQRKTSGITYEKLPKRALYCMYASAAVAGVIGLIILGVINYFWMIPKNIAVGKWISLILLILIVLNMLISPYFRFHRYRYSINEECIDIREGYLIVKRDIVPIERLHKLQTARGPFDQMFKVSKVIVTTGGGDVTLSFLEEEKADQIADALRHRINEIAAGQRDAYGEE